jgi:hypothetical protein
MYVYIFIVAIKVLPAWGWLCAQVTLGQWQEDAAAQAPSDSFSSSTSVEVWSRKIFKMMWTRLDWARLG